MALKRNLTKFFTVFKMWIWSIHGIPLCIFVTIWFQGQQEIWKFLKLLSTNSCFNMTIGWTKEEFSVNFYTNHNSSLFSVRVRHPNVQIETILAEVLTHIPIWWWRRVISNSRYLDTGTAELKSLEHTYRTRLNTWNYSREYSALPLLRSPVFIPPLRSYI